MFTTLSLCDLVLCSSSATFRTPFTRLGQSPEGCSSHTFPHIFGRTLANDILLFDREISATEALDVGLAAHVWSAEEFEAKATAKAREIAKLPRLSMRSCKALLRDHERETLHRVNDLECDLLLELWQSDECINALKDFMKKQKQKKLKT